MAKKLGRKLAESNGDGGGTAVADPPETAYEMGKKRRKGQQEFEGSGFPGPPPEEVCDARDTFLSSMRAHAETAKKKGESEQALIEAMNKHGIKRVNLDGENKYFEIEAPEKVKMKTIPKEQRDERAARESAG